jgi:hypothetical protein
VTAGPGDHGGPAPDEALSSWPGRVRRRAHKRAWKTPPRELALRRLANAEARGISSRAHRLELPGRGRHR